MIYLVIRQYISTLCYSKCAAGYRQGPKRTPYTVCTYTCINIQGVGQPQMKVT